MIRGSEQLVMPSKIDNEKAVSSRAGHRVPKSLLQRYETEHTESVSRAYHALRTRRRGGSEHYASENRGKVQRT